EPPPAPVVAPAPLAPVPEPPSPVGSVPPLPALEHPVPANPTATNNMSARRPTLTAFERTCIDYARLKSRTAILPDPGAPEDPITRKATSFLTAAAT
ncbi:MAG TPA: hypothetical protein VHO06_08200, partial [Polyangia bacterium]|nr:hypothetical protein [Polyangia bacterium]